MKDKDGFTIKCIHTEWQIYDSFDNKDFMCQQYPHLHCYGDDSCEYYKIKEAGNDISLGDA